MSGGYDGEKIHDDIWRLSLPSLQWIKLDAKLPEPVYFHASAITPVSFFFFDWLYPHNIFSYNIFLMLKILLLAHRCSYTSDISEDTRALALVWGV